MLGTCPHLLESSVIIDTYEMIIHGTSIAQNQPKLRAIRLNLIGIAVKFAVLCPVSNVASE